jgi:tetratricopeptide (TPR) repeat protein
MELYKTIIQGRLEFGTEKTYNTALTQFQNRAENHHKQELVLKEEEIFNAEQLAIIVPRFVGQSSEKWFKNTVGLLGYCAQFAVAGSLKAWMTNQGKVLHYFPIEPDSEKIVVQTYKKGKSLVKEKGRQEEAIEALNKSIEKYNQHAQAYERRGKVNFILKKYHDAERDYNKSLAIDDMNPHAYYGRAKVFAVTDRPEEAKADFEKALKTSVALQPLYWKSRRLKGFLHFKLGELEKAAFDLKLFSNRKFAPEDSNHIWLKDVSFAYAKVLIQQKEFKLALAAIDKAMTFDDGYKKIPEGEILRFRGIANTGIKKSEAKKDFKAAIEAGDKISEDLLKELTKR